MGKKNIGQLWPHIHWLTVLAQQGSFTAAARRLDISKSSMSQKMAELEKAAGISLIRRTTRSVRLTEAGQRLVDETTGSFDHIAHSFGNIKDLAEVPSGLVRITAPVAFARQHLYCHLPEFLQRFPRIRLDLDMNDELVSLASDGFDLAIRHVDTPPDIYVARTMCTTRTLLAASPAYLETHGTPEHPSDLARHQHLIYPRQQRMATWVFERADARRQSRRITVALQSRLIANNSEMLRDMACSGAGIALLPDFSAQSAIRSGELVEILPYWRSVGSFGRTIFLLRPYSPNTPRAVHALMDFLLLAFSGGFEIPRKQKTA